MRAAFCATSNLSSLQAAERSNAAGKSGATDCWHQWLDLRFALMTDCSNTATADRPPRRSARCNPLSTTRSLRDSLAPSTLTLAIVIIIVIFPMSVVAYQADTGVYEQRQQLSTLDQLGVGTGFVRLNVQQEPTIAQNFGNVDNAG